MDIYDEYLVDVVGAYNMYEDYEPYEQEEREALMARIPKKYIRDGLNPLEYYSDGEFRRRFRFRKDAVVEYILPKISEALEKPNNRGLPITPVFQLLLTLRFYATASFQIVVGDVSSTSQPSVSRTISRVSQLLALQFQTLLKMPSTAESIAANRNGFKNLMKRPDHPNDAVIPNVEGAIDCTHVRLISTRLGQIAEVFRNRKSYFSINVQARVIIL